MSEVTQPLPAAIKAAEEVSKLVADYYYYYAEDDCPSHKQINDIITRHFAETNEALELVKSYLIHGNTGRIGHKEALTAVEKVLGAKG